VTAVGVVVAAAAAASASVPSLPHRTAAQLLAEVAEGTAKPLGPFTATVQTTANLGLPQLPQSVQPGGTGSPTSGTQSITIWYQDAQHVRVAEPVQAGESDLRLNGRTVWLWSSTTQTATRLALPVQVTGRPGDAGTGVAPKLSPSSLTPAAAASQVLAAVGPSTVVAVQSNVDVAGRAAYQLALAPRSSKSLVSQVLIAIDASRDIPLRVEVFGRGSTGPVFSVGFTSLAFGTPSASNFSFTPPPGATVKQQVVPSSLQAALKQAGLNPALLNPAGLSGLPQASSSSQSGGSALAPGLGHAGGPQVIGQDWLSVVASPPSPQVAAAVQSMLTGSGPGIPSAAQQSELSGSSSSASSALTSKGGPGPDLAGLRALLLATTPVHGNWGSGRLLQTKLLSVLITSKGQILAGAVTPSVLYADVAADAG
jgi:outer membrane lipoprotein-sorting protein